jgi:probable addiction module antidote protein
MGVVKMPRSADYQEHLLRALTNPREAEAYLNAALEDEDPRVFLLALRNVVQARGGMARLASRSALNRESMYRMLSRRGNPSLKTLGTLLAGLGFRLAVEKKKAA